MKKLFIILAACIAFALFAFFSLSDNRKECTVYPDYENLSVIYIIEDSWWIANFDSIEKLNIYLDYLGYNYRVVR